MKKRNEKKAVVCALCLGLTCSNLGMLNIHAEDVKPVVETTKNVSENEEKVAISKENFPDDAFRELLQLVLNSYMDDEDRVPKEILELVTQIPFSERNIKSVEGIQYFTNLTALDLSNNDISSIDLSKNTELTDLKLSGNQLTDLDISHNTNLKRLDAYDNRLSELDLSNNLNLQKVDVGNRDTATDGVKIKTLKLSNENYNSLERFDLKNNDLDKIDLTLFPNLIGLDLGNNNLKYIDASSNQKLSTAYIWENPLISFDYPKNCELFYDEKTTKETNVILKEGTIDLKDYGVKKDNFKNITIPKDANYKYDSDNGIFSDIKGKAIQYTFTNVGRSMDITLNVRKGNGSVTIDFEGWTEGNTPNKPEISSETYKKDEIHVTYRKKGSKETFDTIPTTAGTYELIVTCDENEYYYGKEITREFTIKKQTQEEINMVVNIGDHDYFSLSTLGIELTPENETEIKESLKGATYENGKFINITGNVVTFHYTLGSTICNYNLEIVRNSNQPVIVTMDIKAEIGKDGNIYLKDLNLKNYKDEYASDIKYSCTGARFDNGKFYGFVNDKFIFAYNVNDKLTYQYRVTITKDNTVVEPDVKPDEPKKPDETKPVKPTKPADNKGDKDKPKDAVVKDTSETTQDHTAGLLMGMVTLAGAIIVTNKKHEKE